MPATPAGDRVGRLTRDEQRAQTVERLLDAATNVFAQRGFHSASVDDIATAAGFSKGAVYSNFSGKEELILAVLDRHNGERAAALEGVLADAGDTLDDRLAALGRWFQHVVDEERGWNLLMAEFALYAARTPRLRAELAERDRVARRDVAELIERQAADLGLDLPAPPERLAAAVMALGDGMALQHLHDPGAAPAELFASAVALLLGQSQPPESGRV